MELNTRGIPTRWKKLGRIFKNTYGEIIPIEWKPNSIGVILNNTLYKGKRLYKDEYYDVSPIIDEVEWNKVQEINNKKPGNNFKPTHYIYLLKGKVVCGVCGRHYGARTETRYGKEDSFYYCNGARDIKIRCKNGQFSSPFLEESISLLFTTHQDFFIKLKEDETAKFNLDEKENQIEYFTNQIEENLNKQKRLVDLRIINHIDEQRYNKEHALIIGQNEGFKIKIKSIKNEIKNYNKAKTGEARLLYENLFSEDKQSFIDKYLNKIIIRKIKAVGITKKDIETLSVKSLADDFRKQDKIKFIDKLFDTKYKNRKIFVEIFAFDNVEPLKAIIINDAFRNMRRKSLTGLYSAFIVPTLSIKAGTLSI
jgi:hypothetical protein